MSFLFHIPTAISIFISCYEYSTLCGICLHSRKHMEFLVIQIKIAFFCKWWRLEWDMILQRELRFGVEERGWHLSDDHTPGLIPKHDTSYICVLLPITPLCHYRTYLMWQVLVVGSIFTEYSQSLDEGNNECSGSAGWLGCVDSDVGINGVPWSGQDGLLLEGNEFVM